MYETRGVDRSFHRYSRTNTPRYCVTRHGP